MPAPFPRCSRSWALPPCPVPIASLSHTATTLWHLLICWPTAECNILGKTLTTVSTTHNMDFLHPQDPTVRRSPRSSGQIPPIAHDRPSHREGPRFPPVCSPTCLSVTGQSPLRTHALKTLGTQRNSAQLTVRNLTHRDSELLNLTKTDPMGSGLLPPQIG